MKYDKLTRELRFMGFAATNDAAMLIEKLEQELEDERYRHDRLQDWDIARTRECDNKYWKNIEHIAQKQRQKGINKYGFGLEENAAAIIDRIEYLQEELIDGLMYCEWIKDLFVKGETNDD